MENKFFYCFFLFSFIFISCNNNIYQTNSINSQLVSNPGHLNVGANMGRARTDFQTSVGITSHLGFSLTGGKKEPYKHFMFDNNYNYNYHIEPGLLYYFKDSSSNLFSISSGIGFGQYGDTIYSSFDFDIDNPGYSGLKEYYKGTYIQPFIQFNLGKKVPLYEILYFKGAYSIRLSDAVFNDFSYNYFEYQNGSILKTIDVKGKNGHIIMLENTIKIGLSIEPIFLFYQSGVTLENFNQLKEYGNPVLLISNFGLEINLFEKKH